VIELKIVVSDKKTGKSYSLEVAEDKNVLFVGKRIGEKVPGDDFGLAGYMLELRGGSDASGFPMRYDIAGSRKLKTLVAGGTGFHPKRKGERRKKMLRGNTYTPDIVQVNAIIAEYGSASPDELLKKGEEKAEK
jgi:small subunit ribosomal protein S6e